MLEPRTEQMSCGHHLSPWCQCCTWVIALEGLAHGTMRTQVCLFASANNINLCSQGEFPPRLNVLPSHFEPPTNNDTVCKNQIIYRQKRECCGRYHIPTHSSLLAHCLPLPISAWHVTGSVSCSALILSKLFSLHCRDSSSLCGSE